MIAPRHNLVVAVVLAIIYAIFTGWIITMAVLYQSDAYPLWWLILTSTVGKYCDNSSLYPSKKRVGKTTNLVASATTDVRLSIQLVLTWQNNSYPRSVG